MLLPILTFVAAAPSGATVLAHVNVLPADLPYSLGNKVTSSWSEAARSALPSVRSEGVQVGDYVGPRLLSRKKRAA